MNLLKRLRRPALVEKPEPSATFRSLGPIATFDRQSITEAIGTPAFEAANRYFRSYPARSVMGDESRAVLYTLIRLHQPEVVAEIGTMYAGTTEVMARALWENGCGIIHTTDPYGAERCPPIIAGWPQPLQDLTRFHALNSADFFNWADIQRLVLDLVFIDGNHDYEFALFDLQMAARLIRPGGIVVMDDAGQTGPFKAALHFVRANPAWRELGGAIASHAPGQPFNPGRASIAGTGFILLRAPDHIPIGVDPQGWGMVRTKSPRLDGIELELAPQSTRGTLHYQAILRAFQADGAIPENKRLGSVRLDLDCATPIVHQVLLPLMTFPDGSQYTYEIELAWEADAGAPDLKLGKPPAALTTPPA